MPELPADVSLTGGMVYYHGNALLKVEQRFQAIHQKNEQPDRYTTMPVIDHI